MNGATLTSDRNGIVNKAYKFNVNDDVINCNSTNLQAQNFSISLWFKLNSTFSFTTLNLLKIGPNNGSSYGGIGLRIDQNDQVCGNGKYQVYGFVSSNSIFTGINQTSPYSEFIDLNKWNHYLFTKNNNSLSIYVNNILLKTINITNLNIDFTNSVLQLGNQQNLNNNSIGDRELDDIAYFNRAIDQQEITALYTGCSTPTATITPQSSTTFCQNGSVVLNASTGSGYAYEWYKNGTIINGSVGSSYTANQSGSYAVKVINGSCNATSTVTDVLANPNPTAIITPQSTTTFCQGGSVILNASTGSGNTYVWYKDWNIINGSIGSSYTVIQSGSYTVKVINGTCNATSTVTDILVYPNPTVSFTTLASYTDYQHSPITLLATPSGGTYSGPGVSGSIFDPSIAGLGKKTVTYNVTNSNNCSGSAFQSTIVNDTLGVVCTAYDTITVTDTLLITTTLGLSNQTSNTIKIYPNPAKDHITINNGNFATMPNYTIRIDNALGQQVFLSVINQQSFYVDLSSWSGDGVYFVYLKDAQGTIKEIRKIVLQWK